MCTLPLPWFLTDAVSSFYILAQKIRTWLLTKRCKTLPDISSPPGAVWSAKEVSQIIPPMFFLITVQLLIFSFMWIMKRQTWPSLQGFSVLNKLIIQFSPFLSSVYSCSYIYICTFVHLFAVKHFSFSEQNWWTLSICSTVLLNIAPHEQASKVKNMSSYFTLQ